MVANRIMFSAASRHRILFTCALAVLLIPLSLPAAPSTTGPADEKVWELTDYLKGTNSQIREQLNGEIERLWTRREKLRDEVPRTAEALLTAEKDALDRLHHEKKDVDLRTAVAEADKSREFAKTHGTLQQRLDSSSQFVKQKQSLDQYEKDWLASDVILHDARLDANEARVGLQDCEQALGRSYLWRQKLVNAIRNTALLTWPLDTGDVGILGKVTPLRVDENSIVVRFQATGNPEREGTSKEGISTYQVSVHPVTLIVAGIDTAKMVEGKAVELNNTFEVTTSNYDLDAGAIYTVRPKESQLNGLMNAIDEFHVKVDFLELTKLANGADGQKKSDPKRWSSPAAILSTTRPTHVTNAPDLLSMNEWLRSRISGDILECDVVVDSAIAGGDHTCEVRAHANSGTRRVSSIIAECPASETSRLRKSVRVRLEGTIRTIRMNDDGTLVIELVDAHLK